MDLYLHLTNIPWEQWTCQEWETEGKHIRVDNPASIHPFSIHSLGPLEPIQANLGCRQGTTWTARQSITGPHIELNNTQFTVASQPSVHAFGLWEEARVLGQSPCILHPERPPAWESTTESCWEVRVQTTRPLCRSSLIILTVIKCHFHVYQKTTTTTHLTVTGWTSD